MEQRPMIFKYRLLLLIILFAPVLLPTATGQNSESLYAAANEAYRQGKFNEAGLLYQKILNEELPTAALYYNLGNCHFKMQNTGQAILYYERALKVSPLHRDARFNLNLANSMIRDEFQVSGKLFLIQWWQMGSSVLSASSWVIIHVIMFIFSLIAAAFFLLKKGAVTKKRWFRMSLTLLIFSLVLLGLGIQRHYDTNIIKHAIVLKDTTTMMSSPGEGSSILGEFHEGTKLRVVRTEKGWYETVTPDGHKGWIPAGDAEII